MFDSILETSEAAAAIGCATCSFQHKSTYRSEAGDLLVKFCHHIRCATHIKIHKVSYPHGTEPEGHRKFRPGTLLTAGHCEGETNATAPPIFLVRYMVCPAMKETQCYPVKRLDVGIETGHVTYEPW